MPHARITIRLPEDDLAWIKSQSDALGLDNEAAVVRMLVRQARLGNVSLSVVMQCVTPLPVSGQDAVWIDRPPACAIGRPLRKFNQGVELQPSVGEAFAEDATPVPDDVVNDLLTSRMQELAAAPPPMLAAVNGHPVETPSVAISLRPAPKRQGADYR